MSIQSTEGSLPASGSGVTYTTVDVTYFEARGLKRYAGVASLWALGVGTVISGHFSGWSLGLSTGGWGGLFVASSPSGSRSASSISR